VTSQFLPQTLGAWAAIFAAVFALVASVVAAIAATQGMRNKAKIQEVHVLVNSNMEALKAKLELALHQRDSLQSQKDITADNAIKQITKDDKGGDA
jgi:hypothetical protein